MPLTLETWLGTLSNSSLLIDVEDARVFLLVTRIASLNMACMVAIFGTLLTTGCLADRRANPTSIPPKSGRFTATDYGQAADSSDLDVHDIVELQFRSDSAAGKAIGNHHRGQDTGTPETIAGQIIEVRPNGLVRIVAERTVQGQHRTYHHHVIALAHRRHIARDVDVLRQEDIQELVVCVTEKDSTTRMQGD